MTQSHPAATVNIRRGHEKLHEAFDTTLTAAHSILDGLDRASAMISELDACSASSGGNDDRAASLRDALRDELFGVMVTMQFQDIAGQQLASAASELVDAEASLAADERHSSSNNSSGDPSSIAPPSLLVTAFDPDATMTRRAERQSAAEEILARTAAALPAAPPNDPTPSRR